jgi:hypothetical protein
MRQLALSVDEPWNFRGPDGTNRLEVEFAGFVSGPNKPQWQSRYALLNVQRPFTLSGETVRTLVAGSRYVGQSIEQVISTGGTVAVARVRANAKISSGGSFSPEDVEYVFIGGIHVLNE